jgi:hypothetical protein
VGTHVKIIAALYLLCGIVLGALAFFAPAVLGLVASFIRGSGEPDAETVSTVLGITGAAASVFVGVCAVPYLLTGWGLWNFRPWARIVGIVLAALSLIEFPFGTMLGIYALVIFFRKDTEALFAKPA